MKSSEILWAARDRVAGKWAKKSLRNRHGGMCIIGAINKVSTGNSGNYAPRDFNRSMAVGRLDVLAREHGFHDIETFNDSPRVGKDDALAILEKAAIAFEEIGR